MSILKEIDYTEYVADKINENEFKFVKKNIEEYNYLNESFDPEDNAKAMNPQNALEEIDRLYAENIFYLRKQPWADLLIKRIRKDVKKGFCQIIDVQPSMFIKFMRMIRPVLSLFSKAHIFTQTLNDLDNFYETTLGGCYIPSINKMYVVYRYIDKTKFNLDTFKILLHEYCHYFAYKRHKEYVELFKDMCLKFYTSLVENICATFQNHKVSRETRIKIIAAIMDCAFNYKSNRNNLKKFLNRLWDIDSKFADTYFHLMLARRDYWKNDTYFTLAEELLIKAYRSLGNDEIVNHIAKFNFSYQELYCADEIVAIMSYYKPNTKPYLEMLRHL